MSFQKFKTEVIAQAKAALRAVLVRVGFKAPTLDEATAPLRAICDNIVKARDQHVANANKARSEAQKLRTRSQQEDRKVSQAAKALEKLSL